MSQVVVTRLTSTLPAAIAVLEIRGQDVDAVVAKCLRRSPPKEVGRIHYTTWKSGRRAQGETVVVCLVDPQTIELHLHGGKAISDAAMLDLVDSGATMGSEDVVRCSGGQSFANDISIDSAVKRRSGSSNSLAMAERRLLQASTDQVAQVFLDQYNGAMINMANQLHSLLGESRWGEAIEKLSACLDRSSFGLRDDAAARIVLAGPPNVGKSSLINALSGTETAIVHDSPGTTRDWIEVETVLGGWPVRITDTAGIREASDAIEQAGVTRARERLTQAELVILVVDAQQGATDVHRDIATSLAAQQVCIEVWNKLDLIDQNRTTVPAHAFSISVRTGAGLPELQARIIQQIEPPMLREGEAVPVCIEQVDCLRELLELCQVAENKGGTPPHWLSLIECLKRL